jgi:zinc and cadmium transporter
MPSSTLIEIVLATFIGGALSLACAAGTLALDRAWVGRLIAFAVGALLGAVFLEILPHALEQASASHVMTATLAGILFFFLLEKFVLWRHSHNHDEAALASEDGDGGHAGQMIVVGEAIHNFSDGILIAAAFLTDRNLGLVTAFAIIAHEIPQEVGDFLVLLHSGFSRRRAFLFNVITSLSMVVGGVAGYAALAMMHSWVPTILALAAASMLYVAVADLIPGLHRRADPRASAQQVFLIAFGVGLIALVRWMLPH